MTGSKPKAEGAAQSEPEDNQNRCEFDMSKLLEALSAARKELEAAPKRYSIEDGDYFLDLPIVDGLNGQLLEGSDPETWRDRGRDSGDDDA